MGVELIATTLVIGSLVDDKAVSGNDTRQKSMEWGVGNDLVAIVEGIVELRLVFRTSQKIKSSEEYGPTAACREANWVKRAKAAEPLPAEG